MSNKTLHYSRMFETRNMWPYYSIPHLGMGGLPFKRLVGFEYKKPINIVSAELFNEGWLEQTELADSTEYFRTYWEDGDKVQKLLVGVRAHLQEADAAATYGNTQNWRQKQTADLVSDMGMFYHMLFVTMTDFIISQPQHVSPLQEKIEQLLEGHSNREQLLISATRHEGSLPWSAQDKTVAELHSTWGSLSSVQQEKCLIDLVTQYGWFNGIEGDQPFDTNHYRKLVEEYEPIDATLPMVTVPNTMKTVGALIGELGYLRLWGRHHFMQMRYYLKQILDELVTRLQNPILAYATVEEIDKVLRGEAVDLGEIHARTVGHVTYLEDGVAKIATGAHAEQLKALVQRNTSTDTFVRGTVACRGVVQGRVRVVSFTAQDYHAQVDAFKKGEVLVTGMTRPQIAHLCKKAVAIVTDEGGITSHAAVISREFGIPCVIATQHATKVFKTGDEVLVDAEIGVVTLITREEIKDGHAKTV